MEYGVRNWSLIWNHEYGCYIWKSCRSNKARYNEDRNSNFRVAFQKLFQRPQREHRLQRPRHSFDTLFNDIFPVQVARLNN